MSANPSNARSGWLGLATPRLAEPRDDARNALQALFAFASLHQQTIEKSSQGEGSGPGGGSGGMPPQNFALDEVLQLVATRAISITGADGIAIALAHEGAIVCRASAGLIAPDRGVKLDPNSGFSGACLRSGEAVRCDDSEIDARVNALACRALGARSMVAVPLAAKQHVIGLIEAFSKETFGFNDADVHSLNLLGELILAAIRPEEEDRLSEISRKVIASPLAPTPLEPPATPVPIASTKVLVDEKFVPSSVQVTPTAPTTANPAKIPDAPQLLQKPASPERTPQIRDSQESLRPTTALQKSVASSLSGLPSLETEVAAQQLPEPERVPEQPRSYTATALIAAAVLVTLALGWGVWRQLRHAEQSAIASAPSPAEVKTEDTASRETTISAASEPAARPGALPAVTAIYNSSSAKSSTVVVDLEDQVQYEAHTLSNPDRIYFDLHDTKIAPALVNQTIALDSDVFLKRIRIAQPVEGVTRVVLETKGTAAFTVSLDSNPYRLNIDVHKPSPTAVNAVPTQPKPSPAITTLPGKEKESVPASDEFRLVLDAGHGGWDLGTVGKKGLLEKDLVLDIVDRLGKLVEDKLGAQVIYTRQDDSYLPLEKRAEIANLAKANLFLSVHANYSDLATARGVETYYTNTYSSVKARGDGDDPELKQVDWTGVDIRAKVTDSHRFAADVQQSLYGALAARTPGIRDRGVKEAQYVVLTGTQMPAILAEVSFVSSPADEDKLQSSDYRQQIAEALFKGIARYREESRHPKLASAKKPN